MDWPHRVRPRRKWHSSRLPHLWRASPTRGGRRRWRWMRSQTPMAVVPPPEGTVSTIPTMRGAACPRRHCRSCGPSMSWARSRRISLPKSWWRADCLGAGRKGKNALFGWGKIPSREWELSGFFDRRRNANNGGYTPIVQFFFFKDKVCPFRTGERQCSTMGSSPTMAPFPPRWSWGLLPTAGPLALSLYLQQPAAGQAYRKGRRQWLEGPKAWLAKVSNKPIHTTFVPKTTAETP